MHDPNHESGEPLSLPLRHSQRTLRRRSPFLFLTSGLLTRGVARGPRGPFLGEESGSSSSSAVFTYPCSIRRSSCGGWVGRLDGRALHTDGYGQYATTAAVLAAGNSVMRHSVASCGGNMTGKVVKLKQNFELLTNRSDVIQVMMTRLAVD